MTFKVTREGELAGLGELVKVFANMLRSMRSAKKQQSKKD
jgi:hypothetical protein